MPIDLIPQLLSAAIRACAISLVFFVSLPLFRIRSSAARHAVWTVVLAGMLLQIPLGVMAPAVPLRAPAAASKPQLMESLRSVRPAPKQRSLVRQQSGSVQGTPVSWGGALTAFYLAISALSLVRVALGYSGVRRLLQSAEPIAQLGPHIFESHLLVVPGSVGYFRPKIILPQGWRDWSGQKLRTVLAHESAHIRRRDWLIRIASQINSSIFWFHPLAWWLERELARLAEEACDDIALSGIEDRDQYAAILLEMARAAAAAGRTLRWQVLSMAAGSNVIRRVNRILEGMLPAPKPVGRFAWMTLFACALPVIYLSAAIQLAPASRDSALRVHIVGPLPEEPTPRNLLAQTVPNETLASPAGPTRLPITACVLIDNSGSMRERRASVTAAALALFNATQPGDEVCIVDFNDEIYNALPNGKDFTSDIAEMKEALAQIDSRGGTAMREAIRASIDQVKRAAGSRRRVLVLITEGDDTSSTVTQEQLIDTVRNSGVAVYSIGLLNGDEPDQPAARVVLEQFAEASGGLSYYPSTPAEMESAALRIADEMRKR